jgi:hypothetical protein
MLRGELYHHRHYHHLWRWCYSYNFRSPLMI